MSAAKDLEKALSDYESAEAKLTKDGTENNRAASLKRWPKYKRPRRRFLAQQ